MVQVQDNGLADGGVMTLEDLRSGDEVRRTGKLMTSSSIDFHH